MQRQNQRMLRRNVNASTPGGAAGTSGVGGAIPTTTPRGGGRAVPGGRIYGGTSKQGPSPSGYLSRCCGGWSSSNVNLALLAVAVVLTVASWTLPSSIITTTEDGLAGQALRAGQELEREAIDWWAHHELHHAQKPPVHEDEHPHFVGMKNKKEQGGGGDGDGAAGLSEEEQKAASDRRMKEQSSRWVDSEKKLKSKLKELAAMQAQGKNLGVPVLTRWLGDDIPAWPEAGKVDEWNAKVKAKYDEMRIEEEEWKKQTAKQIEEQNYG